jgi:hypothetical protein
MSDKDRIRDMVMALSRGDHDEATAAASEVIAAKSARAVKGLEEGAGDMEEVMAAIIQGNRGYDAAFDEAKRVLGADFDSGWFMELYNDMAEQSDDDREYHMNQDDPDWDEGQRQQDKIDQFRNEY